MKIFKKLRLKNYLGEICEFQVLDDNTVVYTYVVVSGDQVVTAYDKETGELLDTFDAGSNRSMEILDKVVYCPSYEKLLTAIEWN